jgi:hypothetical protein
MKLKKIKSKKKSKTKMKKKIMIKFEKPKHEKSILKDAIEK